MDEDQVETVDDEGGGGPSYRASAYLDLHLSQELIDQVRVRLSSVNPEYVAILESGGNA